MPIKPIIAASILSADFAHLGDKIRELTDAGVKMLHLDIMDSIFVPNMTFGPPVVASLRKTTDLFFDVHLMVNDPMHLIDAFIDAGADSITIHYESCNNPKAVLSYLKSKHVRAGLAVSPETPVEVIFPVISQIDLALIMTVRPGKSNQSFMADMVPKIRKLKKASLDKNPDLMIQVDGGIKPATIGETSAAGANVFVVGSALCDTKHPRTVMTGLKEGIKTHPCQI
ncbi:MAG: ribulose-phosphate 3-epimerase [Clostridia bacterium]|nr:ribulose-phosphate 3-epimerase [Clostridia bacterium]MBQ3927478.1 ribulose-phosphate 3-epimerase [Clostridia bacterium]